LQAGSGRTARSRWSSRRTLRSASIKTWPCGSPASEAQGAPFIIVADYARWKTVIKKELDPIKGMMQNKLKLTKGHMPTMVKYVNSSRELVETTSLVATKFRDE